MTDVLQQEGPAAHLESAEGIKGLRTTPEQLADDYPMSIRITPTRTRAW